MSEEDSIYTEGVMEDGAAILCDGQPMTINEILDALKQRDAFAVGRETYEAEVRARIAANAYAAKSAEYLVQDDALFRVVYQALVAAYNTLRADLGKTAALNKICNARFEIEKRTEARISPKQGGANA